MEEGWAEETGYGERGGGELEEFVAIMRYNTIYSKNSNPIEVTFPLSTCEAKEIVLPHPTQTSNTLMHRIALVERIFVCYTVMDR